MGGTAVAVAVGGGIVAVGGTAVAVGGIMVAVGETAVAVAVAGSIVGFSSALSSVIIDAGVLAICGEAPWSQADRLTAKNTNNHMILFIVKTSSLKI